ncbi:hypothetical protein EZS27_027050, partial [termite gut metagenome]
AIDDLKIQVAALEKAGGGTGTNYGDIIAAIQVQINDLQGAISKPDAIGAKLLEHQAFVDAIIAKISESNPNLVTLSSSSITSVEFAALPPNASSFTAGSYFEFNTTVGLTTYTFGGSDSIVFVKDQVLAETKKRHVLLKVTPANAILTPEAISLIDSQKGSGVNEYVKVTKAEAYTELITKADESGLWDVTFEITDKYTSGTKPAFESLTKSNTKDVLFALAVNTGGDRLVLTNFIYPVSVSTTTSSVYSNAKSTENSEDPLQFKVTDVSSSEMVKPNQPVYLLPNKFTGSNGLESVWTDKTAANNVDPSKNTQYARGYDARSTNDPFTVTPGKKFEVELTGNEIAKAYAFYIGLDVDNAKDDAEKAAWTKAGAIDGINKVYKLATTKKAEITIKDAALQETAVGFRVYAVNFDGTLVDPDGRAFYVTVGGPDAAITPLGDISFTTDITGAVPAGGAVYSKTATIDWVKLAELDSEITPANVKGYKLTFDGDQEGITSIVGRNNGDNDYIKDLTTSWSSVAGIQIATIHPVSKAVNPVIDPTKLKDDGTLATGKLQLLGETNILGEYNVTLKKELPTEFPENYAVPATHVVGTDGDYRFYVSPNYYRADGNAFTNGTIADLGGAYIQLNDIFTVPSEGEDPLTFTLTVHQDQDRPKEVLTSTTTATYASGNLIVPISNYSYIENNEDYIADVTYNYGNVLFGGGEHKVTWSSYNTKRIVVSFILHELYAYTQEVFEAPKVTPVTAADTKTFTLGTKIQLKQQLKAVTDSDVNKVPTASWRKFYTIEQIELAAPALGYLQADKVTEPSIVWGTSGEPDITFDELTIDPADGSTGSISYDDKGVITIKSGLITNWTENMTDWIGALTDAVTDEGVDITAIEYLKLDYAPTFTITDITDSGDDIGIIWDDLSVVLPLGDESYKQP